MQQTCNRFNVFILIIFICLKNLKIIVADHSMHQHAMHGADHATMDHSAIMSATTTTTEMPADVHIHHDTNSGYHQHAPAASHGEAMLHHAMSMSVSFATFCIKE